MAHAPCVHLHVHTGYSLLSSTVRPDAMIQRAAAEGMPALALTDQGNLFAAIAFYNQCLKAGIKPILGAQVYIVPNRHDKTTRPDREPRDQLILLCRNQEGWQSLMRILSAGHLEGSHGKPRVDWEVLAANPVGLIALSGALEGAVGRLLAAGREAEAEAAAQGLAALYGDCEGAPNFFLELQRNGKPGQEAVNRATVTLAQRLNLPLVASNDVHFLNPEDQRAHDALMCVGTGHTLFDESRPRVSPRCYFLGAEEMTALFADLPEALENTLHIARRCNLRLKLGKPMLPDFELPEGEDEASWMAHEAEEGLKMRLATAVLPRFPAEEHARLTREYGERLAFEIQVIVQMGFPGYFLIVSDFIRWAKKHRIPVGPGRGSGAGSLVAWALQITDLDPIRYNLLFERFLNPERVSMPDFDVDFCMDRREEVIRYVQGKYGHDRVAQIITFGTMQAKAVVRDVGRVLEFPYGRVDRIAKLVPNILGIKLKDALEQEERLPQMMKEEPEVAELMALALSLEGSPRSAGTHAAGVVISNGPLTDTVPLYKDPRSEMPVTQFNMGDVEKAGLVKFDFLGLKTLTVIQAALDLINPQREAAGEAPIDISLLDLDDPEAYRLLKEGRTMGVFQLESSGMREILKKLAPDVFEDIVALVALYRPGPLGSGMVDDFINGKHGRIEVSYPLPQLEPILKETYGVILYQEQVMKIAQVLASYSLGGADLLRRAMGKKKPEEMAKQRDIFMTGANGNRVDPAKAEHIFDLMEKFAGYGFNKSHSAAYALIAYQTAWLKAHYPVAFMAANLTTDMLNTDKVMRFVRECSAMGITVLPPDVNRSGVAFTLEGGNIRYGLGAVKNVGEGAMEALVKARTEGGAFRGLHDLCHRVEAGGLNKRVWENLIKAGAMDSLGGHRAALLEGLPQAMSEGSRRQQEAELGFMDLFGGLEDEEGAGSDPPLPEVPPWGHGEQLGYEKDALGFYITGHPLERYQEELEEYGLLDTHGIIVKYGPDSRETFGGDRRPQEVVVGMVADRKVLRTKKGDRMAFLTLEDLHGQLEVVVFPEPFMDGREVLEQEGPVVVRGEVETTGELPKLTALKLMTLDAYREEACGELHLTADALAMGAAARERLAALLMEYRGGPCRVVVELTLPDQVATLQLGAAHRVHPREALLEAVQGLLGAEGAGFRGLAGGGGPAVLANGGRLLH